MADVINGSTSNNNNHKAVEDNILLKFQRYRERLQVLGTEGKLDELVAHYDMYAQSFGKFFEITGYVGGMVMAEAVARAVTNKEARILDCGCGDGAVGSCLQKMGYTNLDALDPSKAMINECKQKNIYKTLICDCVKYGHTTKIDNGTYDVIAACAAFCPGHMNQSCFHELTRMVKPGGNILFNIAQVYLRDAADFKEGKLDSAIQAMITEGTWESVSTHTAPYFTSGVVEDCVIFTIKTAEK